MTKWRTHAVLLWYFWSRWLSVGVATNIFLFYKSKPITSFSVTEFLCDFTTLSSENAEVELWYLPWNEMLCASVNSFRYVFRRKFFGCPNIYYNDHVAVFVCFTLLVESGDVELNSGPCEEQASAESTMISRKTPTWKHPCALCSKPVRSNQKGILCDFCDRWHHIKCINMDLKTYVLWVLQKRNGAAMTVQPHLILQIPSSKLLIPLTTFWLMIIVRYPQLTEPILFLNAYWWTREACAIKFLISKLCF